MAWARLLANVRDLNSGAWRRLAAYLLGTVGADQDCLEVAK